MRRLIITADDYGLSPSFNKGILELARKNIISSVSVMIKKKFVFPADFLPNILISPRRFHFYKALLSEAVTLIANILTYGDELFENYRYCEPKRRVREDHDQHQFFGVSEFSSKESSRD